jgi:hypothetical protein
MLFKGKLHQPCDYITNVIKPHTWLMVWEWCHFLLASNTNVVTDRLCQIVFDWKLLHIFYAKSPYTENYSINWKSGINFQVMLKCNSIKRNGIKKDLPEYEKKPLALYSSTNCTLQKIQDLNGHTLLHTSLPDNFRQHSLFSAPYSL